MSIPKATGAFLLSRALLFPLIFFFFQAVLRLSLPPLVDWLSDSFLYSPPREIETPADRRAKAVGLSTPLWGCTHFSDLEGSEPVANRSPAIGLQRGPGLKAAFLPRSPNLLPL